MLITLTITTKTNKGKMKKLFSVVAAALLLSGCASQNTTEATPESSKIASIEGWAVDVLSVTPQELEASSTEIFVGKVLDSLVSRRIAFPGEETSLEIVALEIEVTSVIEGVTKVGQVRTVELQPGTERIATVLRSALVGKEIAIYSQASSEYENQGSNSELTTPSLATLQISSPYGVIVAVSSERKVIWPLLSELKDGLLADVLPGGSIMSGSSFGF